MIAQLLSGRSPAAVEPAEPGRPRQSTPTSPQERRASLARHLVLAALVYVPLLLTRPGGVAADTKSYLTLDPSRLLGRAASMWDVNIGLGTVTHQNIGYLWPMGPWYWFWEAVGAPDWVAQRLWLATVMFAAGAGVLFLLRTLRWRGAGMLAAATLYMLSPYVLHYGARISVLLLPWAGLPWLIGLTQRAIRTGSWRHPAIFALVVATIGGVNATALVMAGLGPLLWLPFAVWVHHETTPADALRATMRIGVLTVACSLWWVAGLVVQGGWGIEILRYTETVETVTRTALASEVLRGLGYWFFYGSDLLGPWIEPARMYTQRLAVIAVGFLVAGVAFLAAVSLRWRYRGYFLVLVVVGTAVAVGAHPYDDPSPTGTAFRDLATGSTVGLALRSTPRAVPLVVLGLAVLTAAAVSALSARTTRHARWASAAVVLLAVANLPPLWTGDLLGANLERPEELPSYWYEATAWLDERGHDTRVLELPGSDFAAYRWGNTVDPVSPGLMDRPMVARELIPYGSPPSADLLMALDRRINERVLDPAAIAPVARLLGAGDVLVRSDLQYERYRTPRPRDLWRDLDPPPPGLGDPVAFGAPVRNVADDRDLPLLDEIDLSLEPGAPDPPPVAVLPVEDPRSIVRVAPAERPVVLAGDGEGVVESAAAGLLDGDEVVLYDADLAEDPEVRAAAVQADAHLVVTDSNRRRQRRWNTVRENTGATEAAGEVALAPVPDQRLALFPEAGDDTATVVEHRGVARIQATSYGNHVTYSPEDRPGNAFDGDPATAWRAGAFGGPVGERIEVELLAPLTTDRVRLTQPLEGHRNRWITEVEVVLDGTSAGTFPLGDESRTEGGQEVVFGSATFTTLELVVADDNVGGATPDGLSAAGFAEIDLDGVEVEELVRLPTSLLGDLGAASADHELSVVLARLRSDPRELYRSDEERALARVLTVPTARTFTLEGAARLADGADGAVLDELAGRTGGPTARASERIVGNPAARAAAAFDGDPTTAWRSPAIDVRDHWVELDAGEAVTVSELPLTLVADGRHSVPTRLGVVADGEQIAVLDVPDVEDGDEEGATASVTLPLPEPVTATTLRLVVEDVREVFSNDSFSRVPLPLPVAVAEIGLPVTVPPAGDVVDTGCRTDLLTVDGAPVGVRVSGATDRAERFEPLDVALCGPSAGGVEVGAGDLVIRAVSGTDTGIDLDRLVLTSLAGGVADSDTVAAGTAGTDVPELTVVGEGRTSIDLEVRDADRPFWLVLGQSHNAGWRLTSPQLDDVPPQRIVDGYANGWLIDPGDATTLTLALDWTPQRLVWGGLALSGLAVVACLALAVVGRRAGSPRREWIGRGLREPVLLSPVEGVGVRPPPRTVVVLAVALGIVAALLADWWIGVVVGAAAAAALVWKPARLLLSGGAVVALAAAAGVVLFRQLRWRYPPDFGWADHFAPAHVLAWIAILLLLADVVVGWARRRTEVL